MKAKLVAYEYTPLGFEIVIENTEGRIWNLWYNVQLTDDPESWDSEVKSINKMQEKLGELSLDHRLIRAQMAEFCRIHPLFPKSIAILCKEIGEERLSEPVKIGCEGRDLLNILGYHDSESLDRQQEETAKNYVKSLSKWLEKSKPESSTDSKVFGFLGISAVEKEDWVKNLIQVIDSNKALTSTTQRLIEDSCTRKDKDFLVKAKANYLGRPFNCFKCKEGAKCGCRFPMFIDSGLLCIGTVDKERSMLDEYARFVQEHILAYSTTINSWLQELPPRDVATLTNPSYITKNNASKIANNVHSALGEKNKAKTWLAVCLLKTVKSNRRWHKATELIDDFPESTSWFNKML